MKVFYKKEWEKLRRTIESEIKKHKNSVWTGEVNDLEIKDLMDWLEKGFYHLRI